MFSLRYYSSFQFRLDFGLCSATALWQKVLTGHRLLRMAKKVIFSREYRVDKELLALGAIVPWIHDFYCSCPCH